MKNEEKEIEDLENKKLEIIKYWNKEIIGILFDNKLKETKKYYEKLKTTNEKIECLNKISFYYKIIQQYKNLLKKIIFVEKKENYDLKFYNSLLVEQKIMKDFINKIYYIIKNNENKKEIITKIEEEKKNIIKKLKILTTNKNKKEE